MANTTGQKYGGRKKGTVNKTTQELRDSISGFISKNWVNVQKDFNKMDPKDKLAFIEKMMKYVVPSLSNISGTIDFEKLSDEDLDKIIKNIIGGK